MNDQNVNNLIKKLNKYNFNYDVVSDNEIKVRVMKNVYIHTIFNDDGSIIIKDRLKSGNILSGAIPSNLTTAIIYGNILLVILCALSVCHMYLNPDRILLMSIAIFLSSFLFLQWVIYFAIRIESTKRLLIDWTEDLR